MVQQTFWMICCREFGFCFLPLKSVEFCSNTQINHWQFTLFMWSLGFRFYQGGSVLVFLLIFLSPGMQFFYSEVLDLLEFQWKAQTVYPSPFDLVRFKLQTLSLLHYTTAEISVQLQPSGCYFPLDSFEFYPHVHMSGVSQEWKGSLYLYFGLSLWLLHLGGLSLNFQALWQPQTNSSNQ